MPGLSGVLVMDSDGEDRPQDIPALLQAAADHPNHIICARRSKRSEPRMFRIFYSCYKLAFRILTGRHIDFGNFCFIPASALRSVVYNPATWNHLAASILRSRIPVLGVDTERGRRLAGQSSMNLAALLLHGMSAISVYADLVTVRIVIAMLGFAVIAICGIAVVVAIRLFTDLAIPGWASNVVISLLAMIMESMVFATIAALMLLSARSAKPVTPAFDALAYVDSGDQHGDRRRAMSGHYAGSELEVFSTAANWKAYVAAQLGRFVRGRVLERRRGHRQQHPYAGQ